MTSALSGFVGGLQQGYTFVKDAQAKSADEGRRVKEDARRDQAADFAEETRGRQRGDWDKEDAYKGEIETLNKGFFPPEQAEAPPSPGMQVARPPAPPIAQQAPETPDTPAPAPADPAALPLGATAPGLPPASAPAAPAPAAVPSAPSLGMVQPQAATAAAPSGPAGLRAQQNNLTSMGASMDYLIQRAQIDLRHGKLDGPGMASLYKLRNSVAKEGINDAVQLLAQGDNAGAMKRFNETGDMKGWEIASSVDAVFEHGGAKIPTKIVTVKADDGTTRTVNTAQILVQNQMIDAIVAQAQKGVALDDGRKDAKEGRNIQQQNANTQEAYRRDQVLNMEEQRRLQERGINTKADANAPIWGEKDDTFLKEQYSSKDEMTGARTFDGDGMQFAKQVAVARSRFNGGDSASASAYALAADSNLKAQAAGDPAKLRQLRNQALQRLAQATQAAPAASQGGEWAERNAASRAGAPARESGRREILEQELAKTTDPTDKAAIQRELAGLGPTSAAPAAPAGAAPARQAPAAQPVARPPAQRPAQPLGQTGHRDHPDGVDVRGDIVVSSLRQSIAKLDKNDPRNVDALMKLGGALNDRLATIQENYGHGTKLISQ